MGRVPHLPGPWASCARGKAVPTASSGSASARLSSCSSISIRQGSALEALCQPNGRRQRLPSRLLAHFSRCRAASDGCDSRRRVPSRGWFLASTLVARQRLGRNRGADHWRGRARRPRTPSPASASSFARLRGRRRISRSSSSMRSDLAARSHSPTFILARRSGSRSSPEGRASASGRGSYELERAKLSSYRQARLTASGTTARRSCGRSSSFGLP